MSAIVELELPATAFELGQLLDVGPGVRVELEGIVPFGERRVPLIKVAAGRDQFEASLRDQGPVADIWVVSEHAAMALYALNWARSGDRFLDTVNQFDGEVLDSERRGSVWDFEIQFESHENLTDFRAACQETGLPIEITRLFNPTRPDAGPWYGLTGPQRTALDRAVEAGYYEIPRQITTKALAAEFGVSDQAMTERLRRAIGNLVTNTIQTAEPPIGRP
ncbi:helix-turn-helix domain-containing protein [Halodesulfurarchaeum formicicum]|uniref:helix-turn-helix domain-containing protein n=1 Tax=Halodesulfurarchaeum formicicum TaxID=1873524 RepID=UPI000878B3A0|nr:helix-turn-helix domain-containing protein [Halodesulfurarchaeum formicicum]